MCVTKKNHLSREPEPGCGASLGETRNRPCERGIPRDRIVALYGQAADPGDVTYVLNMRGVSSTLVCTASGATSTWATAQYRFWKITYATASETWTVIDENGITYAFGNNASGHGTVDLGVAWGGWTGPSGTTTSQRSLAIGWSLNSITDLFGNTLTYAYTQVQIQVASASGGLNYTQASYLASITATDSSQIQLQYAPKSADEYQDPHTNPAPPNPWQDRFETQYLSSATLTGSSGDSLGSVTFGYGPTMLGAGNLTKRLLTSVSRYSSTGTLAEPPTLFTYWGQNAADGVTATAVQSGSALYGALNQVTTALGGTLAYAYQAATLSYAQRNCSIAPSGGASTWTSPVVYATDDYHLVTWLEGSTAHVQSYTWDGRWTPFDVMTIPLGTATYASVQVATSPGGCAVLGGATVYAASIDPTRQGAWFPAASFALTPAPASGEKTFLAAGRNFAAALTATAGNLFTFRFTGSGIGTTAGATGWVADSVTALGTQGTAFALSAKDAMLSAVAIAASGTATVTLKQWTPCGTWSNSQQDFSASGLAAANLGLSVGCGFAVAWSTVSTGSTFQTAYLPVWWSADGSSISTQSWPTNSSATAAAAALPILAGSTVVTGYRLFRYTGTTWKQFSSSSITYPGVIGSPMLSVGSDLVARLFTTATGQIADLLAYNPAAGTWSVPTGMSLTGAAPMAAVAPDTSYAVANYTVLGTSLWYRSPDGTWASVQTLPAALTAADLATVKLLGGNYLVYQSGTGTASVATGAYLLQNGGVATVAPAISLTGQQIARPSGTAGSLVGRAAFAAFTGTYAASTSQLSLYRPVFGNVSGAQTGYVVASITSNNGYGGETGANGLVSMAFGYQAGTVDASGTIPLFNTVTPVPGQTTTATPASGTAPMAFYTGLTAAETPATAYPTGAGNAASYTLAMNGASYQSAATATGTGNVQTAVSQSTTWYQVTLLPLGSAGVGYYARPVQTAQMLDGVTSTRTLTYNSQIGFPASLSTTVTNAQGTQDIFSEQYTYFYSAYDASLSLNLLSPVIQTVSMSQPAGAGSASAIGIQVATWRDWNPGQNHWAPDRTYRSLNAAATFSYWTYGQTPPVADFLLTGQVLSLTPQGMILETADALGTPSTVTYDLSLTYPISTVRNGAPHQALWYGCEPYESSGTWTTTVSGQSLEDALTTANFHTGTQSLALAAGTPGAGPLLTVQPADQTRRYLFSAWAAAPDTFLPANGLATWTLTLFDPTTKATVGTPIILILTPTGSTTPNAVGLWSYFQVTLDLPALVAANGGNALGISIQAANANTLSPCYVDELRFMPIDCGFSASVYDPDSFRLTASIDGAGQCNQIFRDTRDNPYLVTGPAGQVLSLDIPTYARWVSTNNGAFQTSLPNVTLSLGSSVASIYYPFNTPDTGDWSFSNASWGISGGQLVYSGTTTATATCNLMKDSNQAARVSVTLAATASATVALGNGTYCMRWTNPAVSTGTGIWTLEKTVTGTTTTLWTNSSAPFDSEWLFAIIDGMVVGYAGSVQLFGYMDTAAASAPPVTGSITLSASGASSFDDLSLLQDPSFTLSARDGLGQSFSTLSLLGFQPTGTNVLFPDSWVIASSNIFLDSLGRPYVSGEALGAELEVEPAPAPATGYDLIPQDQDSYLYSPQGASLTLSQYLAGTNGRTYTQSTFETSPLSRPINIDSPRGTFVTGSNYCTVQTIYGSTSTVGNSPTQGTGTYRVVTQQALRQTTNTPSLTAPAVTVLKQTTTDSAGRILMEQSGPSGGTLLKTGYEYNAAGLLGARNPPNYYVPPTGTTAASWQESLSYDFLGQLTALTSPDSGQTQWAYDNLGRVRFSYNADGVPVSPATLQTLLYCKYDNLGRIIETGYIRDSRYTWGGAALTALLNTEAFPIIAASPTGANQAAGAVSKALAYDTDAQFTSGASFSPYLIGRTVQVTVTPNDGAVQADVETYTYDASGNVLTKTVVMPGLSPTAGWITTYTYNSANQVLSVIYPSAAATAAVPNPPGTPVQVGYGYDRLGRLAAVGGQPTTAVVDPDLPPAEQDKSYAGYSRNTFGQLTFASYNNTGGATGSPLPRTFSYDANQRLSSISDAYFSQAVTYDASASVTGWSYYQPKITTSTSTYFGSIDATQPLPGFTQNFTYDGYGRLGSAQNTLGSAFSLTLGIGGAVGYDSNGNIQGVSQGASQSTFTYASLPGTSTQNRVAGITGAASDTVDFTQTVPVQNGWAWSSSNGAASTSALTTTTPVSGTTQALMLAGGSADHYEVLGLSTFLVPGLTYTLSWSAATAGGYPASPTSGNSGAWWYAVLYGASGPVAVAPLGAMASSPTAWTAGSLTLDLTPAGITALAGTFAQVVWVRLELRNLCVGASGTAGAAVYVKSAGVANTAGSTTVATYGYDAMGNTTSLPSREIVSTAYDICTGLTASIAIGTSTATATTLAFAYGSENLRSRATVTPPSDSGETLSRTITLTGAQGELLATQSLSGTTVTGSAYYINGVQGPFAVLVGSATRYLLTDRLGSLRAVVDGPSGDLLAATDTQAFGGAQRLWGAPGTDIAFTGQRLDSQTGLYNYNARLYDPALGRFLTTDPAGQYASPYAYCGNDPIGFTDPSGCYGNSTNITNITNSTNGTRSDKDYSPSTNLRRNNHFALSVSPGLVGLINGAIRGNYIYKSLGLQAVHAQAIALMGGPNVAMFAALVTQGCNDRFNYVDIARNRMLGGRELLDHVHPNLNLGAGIIAGLVVPGAVGVGVIPRFYRTNPQVNLATGIVSTVSVGLSGYAIYAKVTYYQETWNQKSTKELAWDLGMNEALGFFVSWAGLRLSTFALARIVPANTPPVVAVTLAALGQLSISIGYSALVTNVHPDFD